jgi:hypothetical protein
MGQLSYTTAQIDAALGKVVNIDSTPTEASNDTVTSGGVKTALDLKANDNQVVKLSGNQTVEGIKTFSASPIVPAPTTDFQAATKKYVDDNAGGGAVDSVNGQTGVVVLDADDIDDTATTHKFTTAGELSKLAGIEAGADVTDSTNVAAAGAVMKSQYTPAYSLLAQQSGTGNPSVVTVANERILGRKSGGGDGIEGLTASEVKTILALTKSDVGLGNVDNTSDATKDAATATLTNKTIVEPIITEISGTTIAAAPVRDISSSFTLTNTGRGHFHLMDASVGAIVITLNDTSETDFAASFGEANFFAVDATNPITFAVGGSQTIIGSDLEMDGEGALVGVKYIGSSRWALVGKLKA